MRGKYDQQPNAGTATGTSLPAHSLPPRARVCTGVTAGNSARRSGALWPGLGWKVLLRPLSTPWNQRGNSRPTSGPGHGCTRARPPSVDPWSKCSATQVSRRPRPGNSGPETVSHALDRRRAPAAALGEHAPEIGRAHWSSPRAATQGPSAEARAGLCTRLAAGRGTAQSCLILLTRRAQSSSPPPADAVVSAGGPVLDQVLGHPITLLHALVGNAFAPRRDALQEAGRGRGRQDSSLQSTP